MIELCARPATGSLPAAAPARTAPATPLPTPASGAVARPAATLSDTAWAAALLAVDPIGLGGVLWRGPASPARDQWLAQVRTLQPTGAPLRRVPAHIGDEALLGGLDLAATLQRRTPVVRWGLLREAHGGLLVLAMAERLPATLAARIAAALDSGEVALEREGVTERAPTRLGVVAFDEGETPDERLPAALADRLAIHLHPEAAAAPAPALQAWSADAVAAARQRVADIPFDADLVAALCEAATRLGVHSLRAPWLAWRVACAACALRGAATVSTDDAALAARLVLGPRACQCPQPAPMQAAPADAEPPPQAAESPAESSPEPPPQTSGPDAAAEDPPLAEASAAEHPAACAEQLLQAAAARLPADLLASLLAGGTRSTAASRTPATGTGRGAPAQRTGSRGRPLGVQPGEPRAGARLDLVQTLRAAAPWQALRRSTTGPASALAVQVRREDFRWRRYAQPRQTLTLFAVDASGSQAMRRLAEAKGAVELLLADCYVRRDKVALLAFRGTSAQVLLSPTRSLVRAKRCLAELPGGGGTPLAAGIDAARALADAAVRQGYRPLLVLITDGRANVGRQGQPGRPQAQADALAAARLWRQGGCAALLLDTSLPPQAQALAQAMGARYMALPCADAHLLAKAVADAT